MSFRRYIAPSLSCVLIALLVGAGMFGVTHFHFPSGQAANQDSLSTPACSCASHQHHAPTDDGHVPDTDDCHFCKLLSQLSAEYSSAANFEFSWLVIHSSDIFISSGPIAVAVVYQGRGPPIV